MWETIFLSSNISFQKYMSKIIYTPKEFFKWMQNVVPFNCVHPVPLGCKYGVAHMSPKNFQHNKPDG